MAIASDPAAPILTATRPVPRCRRMLVTGSVLLLFGLAACSSSSPTSPSSSTSPSTSGGGSTASASGSAGTSATTGSGGSGNTRTPSAAGGPSGTASIPGTPTKLTGTITEGVESSCLVLTDDSGAVVANLIGVDKTSAPIGTKVVVSGKFQPDLMTTCQQGTPFAVAVIEQP